MSSRTQLAKEGFEAYQNGDMVVAATKLKQAIDAREYTFLTAYADICLRELDGVKRDPSVAAFYYILAADHDDGDALSYLHSLNPILIDKHVHPHERVTQLATLLQTNETDLD